VVLVHPNILIPDEFLVIVVETQFVAVTFFFWMPALFFIQIGGFPSTFLRRCLGRYLFCFFLHPNDFESVYAHDFFVF